LSRKRHSTIGSATLAPRPLSTLVINDMNCIHCTHFCQTHQRRRPCSCDFLHKAVVVNAKADELAHFTYVGWLWPLLDCPRLVRAHALPVRGHTYSAVSPPAPSAQSDRLHVGTDKRGLSKIGQSQLTYGKCAGSSAFQLLPPLRCRTLHATPRR